MCPGSLAISGKIGGIVCAMCMCPGSLAISGRIGGAVCPGSLAISCKIGLLLGDAVS